MVLGNFDVRTAEYAARLWLEGWGEWLLFSGNLGRMTKGNARYPGTLIKRQLTLEMIVLGFIKICKI